MFDKNGRWIKLISEEINDWFENQGKGKEHGEEFIAV
jgi:hypothetical protein